MCGKVKRQTKLEQHKKLYLLRLTWMPRMPTSMTTSNPQARASETVVHWAGVVAVAAAYRTARERADLAAFGNPLWDGVIEDESDSDEELLYAGTFNPKDQQVVFQSCVAGDDTALWTRLPETRAFQTCRDAVATRRSVRNPSHLFHSALGPSMFQTTAPTQPATESRRSICSAMSADEQILQTDTDAHCHNHADIQHDAVSMHTEPAAPRSPTCPSGCEPALARAASESESDVETGLQASVPPFPAFSFSIGNTTLIVRKDTARVPVGAGRNPEQDAARIGFAVKVTPIRVVSRVEDRSPAAGIAPTGQVVVSEFEVGISTFDGTGDEHRPLVLALHKISAKVDVLPHKGSALHVAELEVKVGGLSVDVRSFGGLLVAKNVGESALVVSRTVRTAASVTSSAMQARRADLFGKPATVESSPRIARSSSFTLTNRWTAISVATLDMTLPCIDDTPKGYTVSLTDFRFTPYLTTIASFAITQTGTHHLLNTSLGEHELANQPFMSILTTHEQPASGSAAEPGVDAQLSKKDYQVSISRVNFKDTADLSFFRTLARAAKCAAATTLPPQSRPAAATPASNQSPPLRIFLFRCSLTLLGTVLRRPLPGLFPQAGGSEPPPAPVLFKAELPQALVSRPESGVPTIATDAATVHICCAALRAWSHARNRAPESTAKTKPQSGAGAGVSTEPHVAWNGEAENPMSERVYVAEQHDGGHVGNSTVQEAKRVCVEIQSIAVSIWDDFTLPDGSCIHTELNSAVVRVCGGVQPKCEAEVFSVRVSYRCGGDTTSVLFLTNPEQNEGAIRLAAAGPRLVVDKRSPTRRAKRLKLVVQTPVQIAIFPPGLVNALSLLRAHQQKSRRDSDDEPSDPLLVKLILQKGSGASCVSLPIRLVSCKKYLPLANALWGTVRAFPEMDKMREHASSLEAFRSMVASILPKPSAAEHWPPATVSAAISRVSESVTSLFNGLAG
ncbi:hypothetical protein DIPPA_35346 [Diplonema papillatum]|nr:hypothetical protein DIPPA_35346 [Diplonema papillatum]